MKKIIICLLSVILTLSVLGCSSGGAKSGLSLKNKSKYSVFELDGKKYDLSGDIDNMVSNLVKDGYCLNNISHNMLTYSDDNGKITQKNYADYLLSEEKGSHPFILYRENIISAYPNIEPHCYAYYGLFPEYQTSALLDYKTVHGITNKSTSKDIESLEGFLPCFSYGLPDRSAIGYFAMYVDGVQINMADYRDELETIMNSDTIDYPAWGTISSYPHFDLLKFVPGGFWTYIENSFRQGNTISDLEALLEEDKRVKYSLLASLAYTEALQKAFDGEVNMIEIYIYTDNEFGPITDYFVFNADTMLNPEETQ